MGVDVEMFVETTDGAEPTDLWLPDDGWKLHDATEDERKAGATHSIGTYSRLYSFGYERGHWPTIGGVLMSLFASTNVKRVWYFGDHTYLDEGVPEFTRADLIKLSEHYMQNGERPYRSAFASFAKST
jgi:hypothetical protein